MDTKTDNPIDPLEQRRQQFAERLQDPEAHITQVTLDIDELLRLGILIDPSFHGVSRFETRISWEGWGIARDDVRAARLRKGRMILLPAKLHGRLRSLEVQMRQTVTRYGRRVTGFGGWWWVPFTAYDDFTRRWDKVSTRLEDLKTEIVKRREELVDQLSADMTQMAHEAWASIAATRPPQAEPFILLVGGRSFETREQFAEYMAAWAVVKFPTTEAIESEVRIQYRNAMLVTSAELLSQQATEEEARTAITEEESKRKQVRFDDDLRDAEKHAKIQAMHQAEMERAREQVQTIISPLQEVMEELQAEMYESVVSLAKVIQKRGHVMGRTADRARNLLDIYRTLNAGLGDSALEEMLQALRDSLDPSTAQKANGHKYDAPAALSALAQIRTHCQQSAIEVALRAGSPSPVDALEF